MYDTSFRRKWRELPASRPYLCAGVIAGSVAAIVASLVNLPLESPADTFFNSASVALGSLAVGLGAGLLLKALDGREDQETPFLIALALAFLLVCIVAIIAQTQLERAVSYIVPLAAIVFVLTGVLTILLAREDAEIPRWAVILAVVVALGIGVGLAGQGDQESGELELPPRSTTQIIADSTPPAR